jgi:hypothetical protein
MLRRKARPIPVRFNLLTASRLTAAAKKIASNRAVIIRLAVLQVLPEIEAGHLRLK